ncbi:MAG: class I SAM-dependent methyltransferase [Rhodocyclaceae bacterium]
MDGSSSTLDVARLGQVFTPASVVEFMLGLRRKHGRVLEPACGDGAFLSRMPGALGIELDPALCPARAKRMDFFAFPDAEKFDTIIGNPPYVRFQDIPAETRARLHGAGLDGRSNLYLFFIEKCVRHLLPGGELIFVTPRGFLKSTSALRLNRRLWELGTISHAVELGDHRVFDGALPNCLIWRFERSDFSRMTRFLDASREASLDGALAHPRWESRHFTECAGHLLFTRGEYPLSLSQVFSVRVGAVSGEDAIFADEANGNRDFVCSSTARTGATRRMIWCPEAPHPALLPHRDRLLARRIRRFDESNWWCWGRGYRESRRPRIYVNCKTRSPRPFFLHPCVHYDGSVMALFPHDEGADLHALCECLNDLDWADLGFLCHGRYLFSQRSLENAPLPERWRAFVREERVKSLV